MELDPDYPAGGDGDLSEMRRGERQDEAILGPCCECGAPCTEHDLVGNGLESDGLGSWPQLWCGGCINRHFDEDAARRIEAEKGTER